MPQPLPLPRFPDIAPATWEHPADAAALAVVRAVPGADRLVAATLGRLNEWTMGWRMLQDARPVTEDGMPRLHRIHAEVHEALDPPAPVPLFARPMHAINAAAIGVDNPMIVIGDAAETHLDDDALRTILAHELGHVLSGHVRWKMTLWTLLYVGWAGAAAPFSLPLIAAMVAALLEWYRKSELSADRAAALACGGAEPVTATLDRVRAEHRSVLHENLPGDPRWRARIERLLRGAHGLVRRHPPVDTRIAEVEAFVADPAFGQALLGHYPRRHEDTAARHTLARGFVDETGGWLGARARDRAAVLQDGLQQVFPGIAARLRGG